jgi:phosphohistidine swiveling domain-containing protein
VTTARCSTLDALSGVAAGGKAEGLARLLRLGLNVPAGFVIVDAAPGELPADLAQRYAALGSGAVAVRSSALDEDAGDASFAGQYETVLNVQGEPALRQAVTRCLASLDSVRAGAYREQRAGHDEQRMCVVVQRMVDARAAGVLFTVDPVSGRRQLAVVDAVLGLGETLVSGERTPDHYELRRSDGEVTHQEWVGDAPILSKRELSQLLEQALQAERHIGVALDLEWAIDTGGTLHWLQARPVTTLGSDPSELDTELPEPGDVVTRCNIGEMMPGAVTPLTYSLTGLGIEHGAQALLVAVGAAKEICIDPPKSLAMFSGQLFLNLSQMAQISRYVAGASPEQMCLSVCGRLVPEVKTGPPLSFLRRAISGVRYARYLLTSQKHQRAMERLVHGMRIDLEATTHALYAEIDRQVPALYRAYDLHLASSALSGVFMPATLQVLARGEPPTEAHHAQLARWLAGAEGVESTDIASGVERIVVKLREHPEAQQRVGRSSTEAALAWLRSDASGDAGAELERYLARHGHRVVRELELRQMEWAADPLPLIASIQASLRAPAPRARSMEHEKPPSFLLRMLVKRAQTGVRAREHTKSLLVLATTKLKRAYRKLGELLVAETTLPDADAIFFLTHEEIGWLCDGTRPELAAHAVTRRKTLPRQMALVFPDVAVGHPEPMRPSKATLEAGVLRGRPVSCGRVQGTVRVIHSLQDAALLEAGEILVARITDAGWTPYFGVIAGLVTDIGSAVSHGAVVAREYGLPCVVDTRVATRVLTTGDRVELDGDTGTVTRLPASA